MNDCIFCKIAAGDIPSYKIWEDENYLAFLDINPTAKGMTLVIPKIHTNSYIVELTNEEITGLFDAIKKVAAILDNKLEESIRTTVFFEGVDVPHLHAKLIPLYKESLGSKPFVEMSQDELKELAEYLSN